MKWANRITIARIILIPAFILAILYHRLDIAFILFVAAALTDALDGYLARRFNDMTSFGRVMDPIADKLLVDSAFICFSLVEGLPAYLKMPIYVPLIIISRDVIILMGAAVIWFLSGSLEVKPTMLGKLTTFFQMITVIAVLLRFVYSPWLWNITVGLTVVSGFDYLRIGMKEINERL